MPRKKKRSGMASCIVSASLVHGKIEISGIAIFPTKEDRDDHDKDRPNSAFMFPADIWIEEH